MKLPSVITLAAFLLVLLQGNFLVRKLTCYCWCALVHTAVLSSHLSPPPHPTPNPRSLLQEPLPSSLLRRPVASLQLLPVGKCSMYLLANAVHLITSAKMVFSMNTNVTQALSSMRKRRVVSAPPLKKDVQNAVFLCAAQEQAIYQWDVAIIVTSTALLTMHVLYLKPATPTLFSKKRGPQRENVLMPLIPNART